ncbi:hypothetical protein LOTGIDRAFT_176999, partial [Lottia gigantea]
MAIGSYSHKAAGGKTKVDTISTGSLTISTILVISMLLVLSGDVEVNPGPLTRQSQLSSSGQLVYPTSNTEDNPSVPGLGELTALMQSLRADISTLRSEVLDLKTEMKELNIKDEVVKIREEIQCLKGVDRDLQTEIDDKENRLRQNNAIFYGVNESQNNTEDCEVTIRDLLKTALNIKDSGDDKIIGIER